MKAEPTPVDQKIFLVFIVTFASMMAFEFIGQFFYPYFPDWRSNLITSLFASGLAILIVYGPLISNNVKNVQVHSEMEKRRFVETELRESESRLSSIIRVAPIGIGVESDGIIETANDQFCNITGYTAGELVGKSPRFLYPTQEDYDSISREISSQVTQKGFSEVESRWQKKDGTIIDILLSSTPVDSSDLSFGVTFTAVDITGQKMAEAVLRESENKFATVFRSSPVTLSLISALDETFVDVNDAFVRNTGYSRDEVIGKTPESLGIFAHSGERERMVSALRHNLSVYGMEVKCRVKTGEIRTCLFSSSVIMMGGKPYILSNVEDITEHKALESAYQTMVRSLVGTTGLNSLQKITENVSSWLGAECVMVGEIQPDNQTVKALSMVLDGNEIPDFSYTLKATLCNEAPEKEFCQYPENIVHLLPESKDLSQFDIRGYIGTPLRNSRGQVFGILCALSRSPIQSFPSGQEIMDIIAAKAAAEIERAQKDRAIRESEEKFRLVVENSLDGILIASLAGVVLFRNRAETKIFDLESETYQIGTNNVMDFVAPESRSQVLNDFNQVAMGIDSYPVNYQAITATGRRIWVEAIGKRIQFQNLPAILISLKDITSRKQMEEEIRESEEKFRMVVENSLDGLLVVSLKGGILFRNRALWNIFDINGESYQPGTKNVMDFVAPESRSQVLQDFSKVALGIDSYPMNYQAITATGRRIWVEAIGKQIQFQNSPAILISLKDITSRKQMEVAILRANKKLNLLSGITRHDINNQLQVLNGYIEMLQLSIHDPSFEDYFSRIIGASSQINAMIRFTKEYEEIGVHASAWQDLQTLVNSAGNSATLGQVALKNDVPSGIEVFADPLIVKVFFNLIDNALRHGGKITTIRFSFNLRDQDGIVVCEDDGVGVVKEEKKRIFDRGFGKHTGLGLAISREILDITGITIKETGEPGKGARFEIMVPKEAHRSG